MGVNRVVLVGNVGIDPDVKKLESGTTVCNFNLATNESYTKDGEKVQSTEWHRIVLWRKLAEIAEQYVKKGDMLYIDGKIKTRSFDDKDGNKRYITEVHGNNMIMLGSGKSDDDGQHSDYNGGSSDNNENMAGEGELPF
jgi:single-strand DNA-binding protein